MIEKIEILQHSKGSHFGSHPCEESRRLLCIVAYHHEMVIQLGEYSLNSLSEASVSPGGRCPVFLVQPVWDLKGDICCFKQIQLHRSTQVSFVAHNHTVVVLPLYVFEVLQVMHIGCGHVIGMYNSADAAQGMELIAVVVHVLRGTIAPGGCVFNIGLSHLAPGGTGILADFHRLGVYAENGLATIDGLGNGLADILPKPHGLLTALVVLATADQIGNGIRTITVQPIEKIVLAVNTECLSCDGTCHNLQVGERGDNTTARNISFLVYLISCKLFAYLKYFSELCNEVAHIYDNVLNSLEATKLLKINDMCNCLIKIFYKLNSTNGYTIVLIA